MHQETLCQESIADGKEIIITQLSLMTGPENYISKIVRDMN